MGRKLMRVPMDFDWPTNERWQGYVNPHYRRCSACDGSGTDASRRALERIVRLILLAGEESRATAADLERYRQQGRLFPHPYLCTEGLWLTARADLGTTLHEISAGLAGREPSHFGHDCCDAYTALKAVIKAAGHDPETWGICKVCGGHGEDPTTREASEAWQNYDPPVGDGYQLWETTSEGSPTSPVFATLNELCAWCADNATTFGSFKAGAEEWRKMLSPDGMVCHQEGNMVFL
jgi:hypothetical protein